MVRSAHPTSAGHWPGNGLAAGAGGPGLPPPGCGNFGLNKRASLKPMSPWGR